MKTHYELLGVDRTADLETIKRAFRREIARYHPDKVMHLGPEFQEMAASRAAELTAAYKSLIDQDLRDSYDQSLAAGAPPFDPERDTTPSARAAEPRAASTSDPMPGAAADDPAPPPSRQFEPERAGRDVIVRRAVLARVRDRVERQIGAVDTPVVPGFDLALIPRGRTRFLGRPLPRTLVRLAPLIDAALAAEAWAAAVRAEAGAGLAPVLVLLFGDEFGDRSEITRALDQQRRRASADAQVFVVLVDIRDWSVRLPPDVPVDVRSLVEALRA